MTTWHLDVVEIWNLQKFHSSGALQYNCIQSWIHLRYLNLWLVTSLKHLICVSTCVRPDCWRSRSSCLAWNGGYLRCPWPTSWKCNSLGGKAEKKKMDWKWRQHQKLVVYFTNLKLGSKSGGYQIRGAKLALYYYPWILSRILSFWFYTAFVALIKWCRILDFQHEAQLASFGTAHSLNSTWQLWDHLVKDQTLQ